MADPDDDPLEDALAGAVTARSVMASGLMHLRAGDPAFAEASALYPSDMSEWQSAVYLVTGNDGVWGELGGRVMPERSIGPVTQELEGSRRRGHQAGRGDAVGDAFLGRRQWPAKFPYVFERFLFYRWVTACYLRQRIPPALTVTEALS